MTHIIESYRKDPIITQHHEEKPIHSQPTPEKRIPVKSKPAKRIVKTVRKPNKKQLELERKIEETIERVLATGKEISSEDIRREPPRPTESNFDYKKSRKPIPTPLAIRGAKRIDIPNKEVQQKSRKIIKRKINLPIDSISSEEEEEEVFEEEGRPENKRKYTKPQLKRKQVSHLETEDVDSEDEEF